MSTSEPLVQSVLLGEAVEHAPVAILVADDEMRYVAANATACQLFGYSREELLQLRVPDIVYLKLAGNGDAMRKCSVAWRNRLEIGVRFVA